MKILKLFLERKDIILIFFLAFLFRLLLVFLIPYPSYPAKIDDAHVYEVMASNLLKGNGFSADESPPYRPTIWRTPGYPLFLAGIYAIFGRSPNLVRVIQALMDSINCLLIYLICLLCFKKEKKPRKLAKTVYFIAALSPFTAFFVSMIYSEILTTFLLILSIFLFCWAMERKKQLYYFFSGLSVALSFLCRPAILIYPFILITAYFCLNINNGQRLLKSVAIYIFAISLVWLPWVYRNSVAFHRFVPLSVASGAYIWVGSYPPNRYEKDFAADKDIFWNKYISQEGNALLNVDSQLMREGIKRIRKEPFKYIGYTLKRVTLLWVSSYSHFVQIDKSFKEIASELKENKPALFFGNLTTLLLIKALLTIINIGMLFSGISGMLIAARSWRSIYPIFIVPICITLAHAPLGQANPRYSVPGWPFLTIFAGFAIVTVWNKIKK